MILYKVASEFVCVLKDIMKYSYSKANIKNQSKLEFFEISLSHFLAQQEHFSHYNSTNWNCDEVIADN